MTNGTRVARLFGVELRVDWTWLFILFFVTWNLVWVFTSWHPTWSFALALVVAIAGALLLFASVVLHELAHALGARAYRAPIRSVTFFLFGGVSDAERRPRSAGADALVALAGPVTSLLVGVALSAVAGSATDVTGDPLARAASLGPATTLLYWLGPLNVFIGLFNLLPAYPLAGGRVLRAAFWGATGDRRKATRWAARTGQVLGWSLVGVAGVTLFAAGTHYVGGIACAIWVAVIGWFIAAAARSSYAEVVIEERLEGMTVARVMRRSGPVVGPQTTLEEIVRDGFVHADEDAVPVLDGEVFVGIVAASDVRAVRAEAWPTTSAARVLRPAAALVSAAPGEPLKDALERLGRSDVSVMPVLEGDRFVGMVRARDIARWLELGGPSGSLRDDLAPAR